MVFRGFLVLPTRKIDPNLTCCDTPLEVLILVCLFGSSPVTMTNLIIISACEWRDEFHACTIENWPVVSRGYFLHNSSHDILCLIDEEKLIRRRAFCFWHLYYFNYIYTFTHMQRVPPVWFIIHKQKISLKITLLVYFFLFIT